MPSAVFWTSPGHRCHVLSPARYVPSFLEHRRFIQRSHCLLTFASNFVNSRSSVFGAGTRLRKLSRAYLCTPAEVRTPAQPVVLFLFLHVLRMGESVCTAFHAAGLWGNTMLAFAGIFFFGQTVIMRPSTCCIITSRMSVLPLLLLKSYTFEYLRARVGFSPFL